MVRDAVVLGLYFALDAIDLLPLCKSCFIEDIAMKNLKRLVHDREIILQNIGLYKFSLERGILKTRNGTSLYDLLHNEEKKLEKTDKEIQKCGRN